MALVVSNRGGLPEVVENNDSGFVIEAGNLKQIIDHVRLLNDDPLLAKKIGDRAAERARTLFSERKYVQTLLQHFVSN